MEYVARSTLANNIWAGLGWAWHGVMLFIMIWHNISNMCGLINSANERTKCYFIKIYCHGLGVRRHCGECATLAMRQNTKILHSRIGIELSVSDDADN